jgi:2-keto-4-pentenoate hydratase/2-oxohepta-3-ene-1,7-dioic acid hydratase in catechol pathway
MRPTKGELMVEVESFGFATVMIDGDAQLAAASGTSLWLLRDLVLDAPRTPEELLDNWDTWVQRVTTALTAPPPGTELAADEVEFAIPGVARPAVYCAGANYRDHVAEMGGKAVDVPFHFMTPPGALNAHRHPVHRPAGVTKLDWEVELAAVIGTEASGVARETALDHVAGYLVANDVSVRDPEMMHPLFGIDWMVAKNATGLTPIGPAIIPRAFVPDPGNLTLELRVNGVVRQSSKTTEMIVDLPCQIEALSSRITLRPGDLILTGTPAGTAAAHDVYLQDGDEMVARVERVGELCNTIIG